MNKTLKVRAGAFLISATVALSVFSCNIYAKQTVSLNTGRYSTNTDYEVETVEIISPNLELKYGTEEEKVLNFAPLHPMLTHDKWLDEKVNEILGEITNEDMSNYEKVRAINDYMVQTFDFDSSYKAPSESYKSKYDEKIVGRAKGILSTNHGTCTEWSALFMVLTRNIGLDVYCVSGHYKDGQHTWNVLRVDGKDYIFDSELDFRVSNSGPTLYRNFCTLDSTNYHPGNKESEINSFNNFSVYK